MLEDVIKTKRVYGKTVSILLYSIDKENRFDNDNHRQYYEIRVSENDEQDNFETYAENYIKRQAIQLFNDACKQVTIDVIEEAREEKRKEKIL